LIGAMGRTGQWDTYSPESILDEAMSSQHGRAASDQHQVMLLKARALRRRPARSLSDISGNTGRRRGHIARKQIRPGIFSKSLHNRAANKTGTLSGFQG
jgi:hypothetical protein